jgi:cation transport ATPase
VSLSTLTKIATQRDTGAPQTTEKKTPAHGSAEKTEERSYLSSLIAAIPTEPLALYTFLVATIVATIEPGGDKRLFMRWVVYAAMIVVIVLWLGSSYLRNSDPQKKRAFPWLETASAVIAFAAWGLAMPESPLNAVLSSDNRTIWTAIITAAGVVILGMFGKPLKEEAKPKRTRGGGRGRRRQEAPAKQSADRHQESHQTGPQEHPHS